MRLPRLRLRSKLILAFAVVLLPVLALLVSNFQASIRQGVRNTLDAQLLAAEAVAVQVDELFDAAKGLAWAVANDPLVRTSDQQQLDAHLRQILLVHPSYEAIGVFDAQGKNRGWGQLTTSGMSRRSGVEQSLFTAVLAMNVPTISDVVELGASRDDHAIIVAVPLRDENGRAVGVVTVVMNTAELAKRYEESRLRPGQAVLLWDRNGRLAFYSLMRELSHDQMMAYADFEPMHQAMSGSPTLVEEYPGRLGEDMRIGAFVPTRKHRWAVGVTTSRSVALAPVKAQMQNYLLGLGGILLLSSLLAVLLARRLTWPARHLRAHAKALGLGELTRRVEINTGDELSDLGNAFNEMASQLQSREAAMRESEERFRATFEQAAVGMAQVTPDGQWMRVNGKLCDILGFDRAELMGTTFLEITHPDDRDMSMACVRRLLEGRLTTCMLEKRYLRKDGSTVWGSLTVSLVRDSSGAPKYLVAIVQDISDRKRAQEERDCLLTREQAAREQAEAANHAKDQFIAVVSHELRTPLTPVLTAVELIKRNSGINGDICSCLELIERNVQMEARLIDDLLDVTRVSQGKIQLRKETVDVHTIIEHVLNMFRTDALNKGIALRSALGAAEHHLYADPGRLQQVIWNLIGNAMKFTPSGGTITVSTGNDGDRLRLQVSDTGIGIEPELIGRLFRPFEQGERSRCRRFGGLGLGLSICKSLVELHGGRISASSPGRDQGATFTVELPAAVQLHRDVPSMPILRKSPKRAPVRILLVEDNEDTLGVLSRLLQHMGHRVTTATSARAAMEAAAAEDFDLLLSDIGLPDSSGWELMQNLQARKPIRGIAISGYGAQEDTQRSQVAGFSEHITKPINIQRLEELIDEVMVMEGSMAASRAPGAPQQG